MRIEPAITPAGHLLVRADPTDGETHPALVRVGRAFSDSTSAGLFALAAESLEVVLAPALAWWREFAARYLTELCHALETDRGDLEPIEVPAVEDRRGWILELPPMPGAEYVTPAVLARTWEDLDDWVRAAVAATGSGLPAFLERRARCWHHVGRVCFHLAENRRDPEHPFAFLATYAPALVGGGKVRYRPLGKALQEYAGRQNRKALAKLLTPVHRASERSPLIRELLEAGDIYQPLAWTPRQAYRFLQDVSAFEESGVLVRLPDWWRKRSRLRVGVSIGSRRSHGLGADGMLDFGVEVALGEERLTPAEWHALQDADEGLVLLRGQWVEVDPARLAETLEHWQAVEAASRAGLTFREGMRLLAGAPADLVDEGEEVDERRAWSFVRAGPWLAEILAVLRDPERCVREDADRDLRATLRPYQEVGVAWLRFLAGLGLGACLADDMGLGKTIQVLSLLLTLKKEGTDKPSLVVLPASLLANWKDELERFAPTLSARYVHPSLATKDEIAALAADPDTALSGTDVVLTTYGMLLRQSWMHDVDWRLIVLDEAQAIKNPAARQTKAVKRIRADARIALTGTPVENRLSDLWSLFDFLCPGLLGSHSRFKAFVGALEERSEPSYAPLRRLVQPYILRRMKTDRRIIRDLPEKTEVRAFCGLGKRQVVLYRGLVDELAAALETLDGIQRRGLVLAYLLRFKQVCNHPSQLLDDGVFEPASSGKFARLGDLCAEIASRGEKALVFTQFRSMTAPLARFLSSVFGRSGLVLHGSTPVGRRRALVAEFQTEAGPPYFVLSLKAGGTGLNLTAASHVIHFDRWWNPAVENQATDRAFRIGQQRNVLVHKFVCQGTIEEQIDALIQEKTRLATDLLEGGAEKMLTEMADEELIRLVSLDVERTRI